MLAELRKNFKSRLNLPDGRGKKVEFGQGLDVLAAAEFFRVRLQLGRLVLRKEVTISKKLSKTGSKMK